MDAKALEKKDRLLAALEKGMVMIHLDARRPGVSVPPSFRDQSHVRLNLSYRFDPPDLTVNEWGVRSSLSFSGSRYACAVPWSALFAVVSHVTQEFWMFPDDMPPELLQAQVPNAEPAPPAVQPAARAALRQVAALPDDPPPGAEQSAKSDAEPRTAPDGDGAPAPEVQAAPALPLPAPKPRPALAAAPALRATPPPKPAPAEAATTTSVESDPPPPPPTQKPDEGPSAPKGRGHLRVVK